MKTNKEPYELTGPDKKLLKIKRADRADTTVPSPCIDVCRYAVYTEKLCVGCFRNEEELINWWAWDVPRKLQALKDIEKRKEKISAGKPLHWSEPVKRSRTESLTKEEIEWRHEQIKKDQEGK
jgi:predicted Fe-S protein YdhL (DUF1289 family)